MTQAEKDLANFYGITDEYLLMAASTEPRLPEYLKDDQRRKIVNNGEAAPFRNKNGNVNKTGDRNSG